MNDLTQADGLVRGLTGRSLVGDRACDSDAFLACVQRQGMAAVNTSRRNRKVQRALDAEAYAERNVIERWFGGVKAFRRVATRYDKTAAAVVFAALLVALWGWGP